MPDRFGTFFLVIISSVGCFATYRLECGLIPADFIFLLDSSGSEGDRNFNKQVDFVRNFTQNFKVGPNNTQFASVTFSTGAHVDFYLNSNHDNGTLQRAVNHIHYRIGETNTHLALHTVSHGLLLARHGARANTKKYVILLTDGRSNEDSLTVQEAEYLKKQPNVTVIVLGIGNHIDGRELSAIASDQHHVFNVQNFDFLHEFLGELQDKTCTPCGAVPADICFVLDASGSVGSQNFQLQLNFMSDIVNKFDIGPSKLDVAAVTFASSANTEFELGHFANKAETLAAINKIHYLNGDTRTDLGLKNAYNIIQHEANNGHKKIVVVLTDGHSNEPAWTATSANKLHQAADATFVIGIGRSVRKEELEHIASGADKIINVTDFQSLKNVGGFIIDGICRQRVEPPTTTTITTTTTTTTTPMTTTTVKPECGPKPADIVFLLDSSESESQDDFQKEINFAYNFAKRFQIGPNNVQFSSVTYASDVRPDFQLNTHAHRHEVLNALQALSYMGQGTNTSYALKYVREHTFRPENGGRNNASHIAIVITDGASSDPGMTAQEANRLHHSGINVFTIGVGDQINHHELQQIASHNDQTFTVNNFDLLHTIQESLENAACSQ